MCLKNARENGLQDKVWPPGNPDSSQTLDQRVLETEKALSRGNEHEVHTEQSDIRGEKPLGWPREETSLVLKFGG